MNLSPRKLRNAPGMIPKGVSVITCCAPSERQIGLGGFKNLVQ